MKWRLKGRFWMARLAFLAVSAFVVASTVNLWVGYKIENALKTVETPKNLPSIAPKKLKNAISPHSMIAMLLERDDRKLTF